LCFAVAAFLAGYYSDKWSKRAPIVRGSIVFGVAAVALMLVTLVRGRSEAMPHTLLTYWMLTAGLALIGVFAGTFNHARFRQSFLLALRLL
jgi:MFS family permease